MTEKKKKTDKSPQKITKKQKKEIVKQEVSKIEVIAQKAALKAMTEAELSVQIELTEQQKKAAEILAGGFGYDAAAAQLGKPRQEVVSWMGIPTFARLVKDLTLSSGPAEKDERIRIGKRIVSESWNEMLKRIEQGDLEDMTFSTLEKFLLTWSQRLDALVDKKEDDKVANNGLAVLILQHVQSTNGKKYSGLEEFLDDEEFKFPTIDAEVLGD